jgi:hypothetical protein
VSLSARAAGRGAAAAYAFRTGNAEILRELGLDYDALRANPDPVTVTYLIVQAVCEPLPDGTIEDSERRDVVGDLVEWVLQTDAGGAVPEPDEIARQAISHIIAEAYLTETSAKLNQSKLSRQERVQTERDIRGAADELARQAGLSATNPTAEEFTRAIEQGLATLRAVYEEPS